jgi:hypothetical protein
MGAKGWSQTRVETPLDRSKAAFATEVAGDGRARLHIRRDKPRPAAPLRGALSYPASWRAGRWSGEAVVSVIPQWSWGYELLLAVSAPTSLAGRVLWSRRRIGRLANGLAAALKDDAERSARLREAQPRRIRRPVPSENATATSRWLFVSATSSSPSTGRL